jgi:hypothetical protein
MVPFLGSLQEIAFHDEALTQTRAADHVAAGRASRTTCALEENMMLQRWATVWLAAAIAGGSMVAFMPRSAAGQDVCSAVADGARGVCRAYCRALDCPDGHPGAACEALRKQWRKLTGSSLFPCDGPVAPTITCEPVAVTATHGEGLFVGNLQLGRVVNGKIPCAHSETAEVAECDFDPDHLDWLESPSGRYVLMGQATSLSGAPGEFVTAGQVSAERTLACIEPTAGDTTGLASAVTLSGGCMSELILTAANAARFPLENFTDLEVCSTDQVHPDAHAGGPDNTRCFLNQQSGQVNCCWRGEGAALNDRGGRERDRNGVYLPEPHHCHMYMPTPSHALFVAKRPPSTGPGPIVWRPVSPLLIVANGGAAVSRCEPVELTGLHVQGWIPGGNARLARIENGKVPCLHRESLELAQCDFTAGSNNSTDSGTWVQGPTGTYALIGQAVPLQAGPGGARDFIVAAQMNAAGHVACTESTTGDTAGSPSPAEHSAYCVIESAFASQNATGGPLVNHANQTVRTSSNPHPDTHDGGPTALGCTNGSCSYTGEGAALNEIFGTERNASGVYYSGIERCHMIVHNGVVVPGAKRAIGPDAPLQWLPVDPTLTYANGPGG